ncbi:MAG: 30S ribosomal protein S9 [candidate division WS6 bacterium OLB20]|uniref:Small ribosomal subunit protein uS9 n=1 Tax=candidate division WS6 bacterium OLB20 TaxID=1617426 RepID=A0A136LX28_9BACT|nr:MAG: 30S ribosomal protein S9 [candidate division WS6 bacterium OLB20]
MADKKTDKYSYAKGRRKTASATVRLFAGTGQNTVNEKPLEEFFPVKLDQRRVMKPLQVLGKLKDFHFTARTTGGGTTGQAGAVRHALTRALVDYDQTYRGDLKKEGLLTRDPRMVERKKTGLRKARKSEQFSKR